MSTGRRTPWMLAGLLGVVLVGVDLGVAQPSPAAASAPLPAAIPLNASIPAAPGPCVAGWREMPVPNAVFFSTPFEAETRAGKPAWILGGTNDGILALKWTGSYWKRAAKNSSGHRGIVGAQPIGTKRVLTVGYDRPPSRDGQGKLDPISGRVVGTSYVGRRVPDPPGPRATMTDVVDVGGGKLWAVGTRLADGKMRAYAMKWTGKAWQRKEPWSGTGAGLLGADRTTSGTVWAVGWREASAGRPRPLVAKRTNKGWQTTRGAKIPAGSAAFTDVDFRGGKGWAVGYLIPVGSSRHEAFLQHRNGNGWSNVPLSWAADFAAIPRSVSVGEAGDIWIAGTQIATGNREARGFVAHFVDGAWTVRVLDVPKDVRSEVMDIGATSWGAIAAGNVGGSLLVMRTCATEGISASSSGKKRIPISAIKARRATEDGHAGSVGSSVDLDSTVDSTPIPDNSDAGTLVTLGSPTKPVGFVVRDRTAAAGLASNTRTHRGFAADVDGNGWKDVFYSRHGGVLPRLAMNQGGRFKNSSNAAFSTVDRHGCDVADVDKDGAKDILCAVGASRGKAIQRHELSLAPHTKNRRLARGSLGIKDPLGRGRNVGFIRLDKDPYPEVFVANGPDRADGMPAYNRFFKNEGGQFVSAPAVGLDGSHGGSCVLTGDFDQDGDEDLAYCTQTPVNGRGAGLRFMRNEGGKLKDRSGARGIRAIGDIDAAFGDVDGDGRRDLVQLSLNRLRVSRWTSSGYRKIYDIKLTDAWAVAVGDASGDGKADIYIARGTNSKNRPDRLLISKNGGTKFASVKIPQTKKGTADDVFAIDYDKNGLMDFVVLNGRRGAGPVQLLASFKT